MTLSRHHWRLMCLTGAASLVLAAGCDYGPRCTVEGKVTYDGQIVDDGGIAFIPVEDGPRATGQIRDGHYSLDSQRGPGPGKYRVEIHWKKKTGKQAPGEGGILKDEYADGLPAKYNTDSELIVDVQRGRNTFPFELKK